MRPFLCQFLKCDKCGADRLFYLNISEISKVDFNPNNFKNLNLDSSLEIFLNSLADQLTRMRQNIIDLNEIDIQLFIEDNTRNLTDHPKIAESLFGIDVKSGILECTKCQNKKNIRNGILIYDE